MEVKEMISEGKTYIGLELGSTRIKAVLIDDHGTPLASGSHEWENQYVNGIWTYALEDVWAGIQNCYADLKKNVKEQFGITLKKVGCIGISAMMHGFLPFNEKDELLTPFRTWRNTITEQAANELTELMQYNIPQRWSVSHVYQAILNKEPYVKDIRFMTVLSGYVHWKLTGRKVLGVGDASGMFPIDSEKVDYYEDMVAKFDEKIAPYGFSWKMRDVFPKVLGAGEDAGVLTEEGAKLLDPDGDLEAGIRMAPPEGDAGTGMVATNSVGPRTGNVSAGTSIFSMIVLEKELSKYYQEIDMVTTPAGAPVAMVHCNNCTSDINDWISLFDEFGKMMGASYSKNELFTKMFEKSLEGDPDCGGLVAYNYVSGEPVTGFIQGAAVFARTAENKFNLSNFMRLHIYSAFAALTAGMNLLFKNEDVKVDKMYGHGGLFKTKNVAQAYAAAAMNSPVIVMETAGEGGPWGMALLALYMAEGKGRSLPDFLNEEIFAGQAGTSLDPKPEEVKGYEDFMNVYMPGLAIERAAVETMLK